MTTGVFGACSSSHSNSSDLSTGHGDLLSKFNRIPIENVVFHEKLGSGQFGDVYRGVYKKNVRQTHKLTLIKYNN